MTITVTNIVTDAVVATGLEQTINFAFMVPSDTEVEVVVGPTRVPIDQSLYTVDRDIALDGSPREGGSIVLSAGAVTAGVEVRVVSNPALTQDQIYNNTGTRLSLLNEGLDRAALRALRALYNASRSNGASQTDVDLALFQSSQAVSDADAALTAATTAAAVAANAGAAATAALPKAGGTMTGQIALPAQDDATPLTSAARADFVITKVRELGTKNADLESMAGYDPTGANDMTTEFQDLVDQALVAKVPVSGRGALIALTGTVDLPAGTALEGTAAAGSGYQGADPRLSTTFLLAHLGKGFTTTEGQSLAPLRINGIATKRVQPAVGPGWAPNDADFDMYFNGISEAVIENCVFSSATRGLLMNGGHNTARNISGDFFKNALTVEWSYDVCRWMDWHVWPYMVDSVHTGAYKLLNLDAFVLKRADNHFMSGLFSILHRNAVRIGYWANPLANPGLPAGSVSKLKIVNSDFDVGRTAYRVDAAATNHTVKMANVTMQGTFGITGYTAYTDPLIVADSSNMDMQLSNVQGDAVAAAFADLNGSNNRIRGSFGTSSYNNMNLGVAALNGNAASNIFNVTPGGSRFGNGNGAPIFAGLGKVTGIVRPTRTLPVSAATGSFGATPTISFDHEVAAGGLVNFSLRINNTNNGTAANAYLLTLPYTAKADGSLIFRCFVTGALAMGSILAGQAQMTVVTLSGNPFVTGVQLTGAGHYYATGFDL